MAKFSRFPKLSKEEQEDIVIDLCEAIASTQNTKEAAQLLTDLLGKQELEMVARRLKVAEMLIDGYTYDEIVDVLKISQATIARVQVWLQASGEGYRLVVERIKKKRKIRTNNERKATTTGLRRKYPLYFWPQLLLEHWVKTASVKQKHEMRDILSKIQAKPKMYKELSLLLNGKN